MWIWLIILIILWILNGIFCVTVVYKNYKMEKDYKNILLFKKYELSNFTVLESICFCIVNIILLGIGTRTLIKQAVTINHIYENIEVYQKEYEDISSTKEIDYLFQYVHDHIFLPFYDNYSEIKDYVYRIERKYKSILEHTIPMYQATSKDKIIHGFTIIKNIIDQNIVESMEAAEKERLGQKVLSILYNLDTFLKNRIAELEQMKTKSDMHIKKLLYGQVDDFVTEINTLDANLNNSKGIEQ